MRNLNLKANILLPLALVSALVLAIFVTAVFYEEQEHLAEDLARSIQSVDGHYLAALKERAHKLETALDFIAADPILRAALAISDRDTLLSHATPIFQRLKTKHNITHFYFHDKQRVNILRVHQPNRYGDTINRYTALGAEKTKTLFHDVELGPLGTFTLRAVLPIWEEDKLLGYIEIGEEVDQLVQEMEVVFGVDLLVAIDKQYLRQPEWESGMSMLGRKAQWEDFPNLVIVSQTLDTLPNDLGSVFLRLQLDQPSSSQDFEITQGKQHYRGRLLTLQDAGQRDVGRMVVLRNMTARIQSTWNTVAMISGGALILGAILFLLFYVILGRTERQLKNLLGGVRESQLHLTNAQRMAHLGNWEWDLNCNTLHCSNEAAHILGLTTVNGPPMYEQLFELIHPADRNIFKDFIDKVRRDTDIHELLHRIIRPDGSERVIRHQAKTITNPSDKTLSINATIHDITELQQAETRSARMGHILEHAWNEIYTFDAVTLRFIEVSDGACQNLGYSKKEMRQLSAFDLKPEFTHDQFEALIGPLRRGEKQQISFETKHRRKDGSLYPVEVRLQLSATETPAVFIAIIQDISERKRYIEELEHKALYDGLTGLANRSLFQDRLEHALKVARREASPLAVLTIDVVRLREINDLLGHHNGDRVLVEVAKRLQNGLRESDTVARLGGDEFVIVLPGVDVKQVYLAIRKIQKLFEQPVIIEDTPLELEAAIGIAQYPDHGESTAILMQHADIAMRIAKNETSGFSIYSPNDDPFSVQRLKLHGELRQAINNKELAVHYQPKIDIKTGKIVSVEALSRWPHPSQGMISPVDFIPMVEQSGMIRPFTLWVLEQTIKQSRIWIEAGIQLTVAVNLSTRNLLDPSLAESIAQLLQLHRVSPDRLTLEITESAVMSRPEYAIKMLTRLHAMGLKLSIDDFGTGYSSLSYLKKLPVAELKIDYSFVSGINNNESDAVIVRSTIDLAHNLGLSVVAEGIEDKETLDKLAKLGCDIGQGYYFSRPLPIDELSSWLAESSWGGTTADNQTSLKD